jgi:predicted ribosome quality control (RQC) complex YloA/Tae2 family protein
MRIPLVDLKRAIEEQDTLRGKTVDNVYQCGQKTLLLKLTPGPVHLLLEMTPGRARVLVTDEPPMLPDKPPVFATILRKFLRGGRVRGVMLPGEDRVVAIDVEAAGELWRIMVEALPRHGNLLLLNADGEVVRVLDGAAARHRGNAVGAPYEAPEPPRFPPDDSILKDLPDEPFAANHALDRMMRADAQEGVRERETKDRQKVLDRLQRAIGGVERDLRRLADPQELREQGELLLCHFGDLKQGMKKFRGVPLDPKLNPPENVDRLFEKARKAKRARPILEQRKVMLQDLLARAEAGEEIAERAIPGRKGGPQPPRRPYRVFLSLDGERILVGKGGRDNDETTLKVAGPHDLFLHVRGTPGAHVIVPMRRGQAPLEQTLIDAAHLALHYSKMRNAPSADVTYTPRKHVSKPKGAKPGLVTVRQEKVLRLRREPERLARLLMSAE